MFAADDPETLIKKLRSTNDAHELARIVDCIASPGDADGTIGAVVLAVVQHQLTGDCLAMASRVFKPSRHPALARPQKRHAPPPAEQASPRASLSRTPRSLTVTSRRWFLSGSRYSGRFFYLRFSGRWLEERGFTIGSAVGGTIEPGRIILTSAAHDSADSAERAAANMRARMSYECIPVDRRHGINIRSIIAAGLAMRALEHSNPHVCSPSDFTLSLVEELSGWAPTLCCHLGLGRLRRRRALVARAARGNGRAVRTIGPGTPYGPTHHRLSSLRSATSTQPLLRTR